jgi:hypothetical protein
MLLVRYSKLEIRLKIDMLRIGHELSVGDKAPSIIGGMWCPLGGVVSSSEILLSPGEHILVYSKQGSEVNSAYSFRCKGGDTAPTRHVRLFSWLWRLK